MARKFESLAREQLRGAEPVTLMGIPGHKLNGGGLFTSRLGEMLYQANGTFGMLWRIEAGQLRVSLRAKTGGLDVSAIAKHFGGGGHKAAASFRLQVGTPQFSDFLQTYILGPGA